MSDNRASVRMFVWVALVVWVAGVTSVSKALTIIPTFDSSITDDANAADIETGINNAIEEFESYLLNNVTVNITFKGDESIGLAMSNTVKFLPTYTNYLNRLQNNQMLSSYDTAALATLPAGPNNPATGDANMNITAPLERALGFNAVAESDSTISVKLSITNYLRTGPQDSDKYDLQQVVMHEITEALGAGGAGSTIGGGPEAGSLDLFRYSADGTRSYTTDPAATAYFSIDGGATNLRFFNQYRRDGSEDYADWATIPPNAFPQVQDAYSTPGVQLDLNTNELIALDVVGWNVRYPSVNWTGLGADNKASTAANWSPNLPWSGDTLVFDDSPSTDVQMNLLLGALRGISFPATAPAYTLRFPANVDLELTGTGIINSSPSTRRSFCNRASTAIPSIRPFQRRP